MKLSVVTPCFNAARYIQNCVESVRYACAGIDYEHILVDGGSTDGTVEYLRGQPDVKFISEKDHGMYDALNKAIGLSSGEVIAHLNSDEQYSRLGLISALRYLSHDPSLEAVMGPTVMLNGRLEFMQLFNQVVRPDLSDVYWHMPVQSCSLLYRRSLWEREPYNTNYKLISDHVWFRKQMEQGLKIRVEREPIGIFIWHGHNLSSKNSESGENALADIDTTSFRIGLAKRWYRLRKFLVGGYCRIRLRYELIDQGNAQEVVIFFPRLKIRKFDKTQRS